MALYQGFFDAHEVEVEGETTYDRTYTASEHMEFYSHMIGSGVCIADNADSFKVSLVNGNAVVAAGYLFINGYWLKNTANYTVNLSGQTGMVAIVAQLNLTQRLISLGYSAAQSSYNNALCLAVVNKDSNTITDTREDETVCGVVDTAGSMSSKAAYAKNYIDTEVEGRLATVESDLASAVTTLTNKVDEVESLAAQLGYPAVGEVKYSMATLPDKWIKCDGRYISVLTYPALVAALTPSTIQNQVTVKHSVTTGYISNGVLYEGFYYFVDFTNKMLIGVPVSSGSIKTIDVSALLDGSTTFVTPSNTYRLYLSISNGYLFIAQRYPDDSRTTSNRANIVACAFNGVAVSNICTNMKLSSVAVHEVSSEVRNISEKTMMPLYVIVSGSSFYFAIAINVYSNTHYIYYCQCSKLPAASVTYSSSDYTVTRFLSLSKTYTSETAPRYHGLAFSDKNSNEFLFVAPNAKMDSIIRGTYTTTQTCTVTETYQNSVAIPVMTTTQVLQAISLDSNTVRVNSVLRSGIAAYYQEYELDSTVYDSLYTKVYSDCSVAANGKFYVFLGTGLLVMEDLSDATTYRFFDLRDQIGEITGFAYMNYVESLNTLWILGVAANTTAKLFTINLSAFDDSGTGVYLPTIQRDGMYGYIKAVAD